jgi:hypothetical protein
MTTLAELRTLSLQRCDMVNSNFVSTSELNSWINQACDDLYDLIVSRYEDYYTTSFQFTINSPSDGYTLPTSVYKIRGLDFQISGDWVTIHTFTFEERNRGNRQINRALLGLTNIKYKWIGSDIKIIPGDQAAGTYRCWYIPDFVELSSDASTLSSDLDRWKEYIIAVVAIICLVKEESDPSAIMAEKAQLENRVRNMAQNRDAGAPERVQDVSSNLWDDPLIRI